jgi:hypothetical protein
VVLSGSVRGFFQKILRSGSAPTIAAGVVLLLCGGAALWLVALACDAALESLFGGAGGRVYLTHRDEQPWHSKAFSYVHPPWVIPRIPPGR